MPALSVSPKEVLQDDDAFATALLVCAADGLGMENVIGRDPEGLVMDVEEHYGIKMPNAAKDRLVAAATIVDTDLFYSDPGAMNVLSQVLAGEDLKSAVNDIATFPQLAWSLNEAWLIYPEPEGYSTYVVDFVLSRAVFDGFLVLPRSVRNRLIDRDYKDREITDPINVVQEMDSKLFLMAQELHRDRADEVDQLVYGNMSELLELLSVLDLKNRDPKFEKRIAELTETIRRSSGGD